MSEEESLGENSFLGGLRSGLMEAVLKDGFNARDGAELVKKVGRFS
jgi:hypothetical protein